MCSRRIIIYRVARSRFIAALMENQHTALRLLYGVAVLSVLGCLGYFVYINSEYLFWVYAHADLEMLAVAAGLMLLMHFLLPLQASAMLSVSPPQVGYRPILYSYARRLPARYVPGGIWHTAARAFDFHRLGVDRYRSFTVFASQVVLLNGLSLLIGGVGLLVGEHDWVWIGVELTGIAVVVSGLGFFMAYLSKQYSSKNPAFDAKTLITATVAIVGVLILFAGSFVAFVSALPGIGEGITTGRLAAVFLFARGIGFLAFFAPNGLGVFELVAARFMVEGNGVLDFAVVLAGFRVVGLAADLIFWSVVSGIEKTVGNCSNRHPVKHRRA